MEHFYLYASVIENVGVQPALVYGVIESYNKEGRKPTRKELEKCLLFLSTKQIRTCLKHLEESKLVKSEQPYLKDFDVTKVYEVIAI